MAEEEGIEAELPLDSVGTRLARAREAAGLSRAQLAERTRIGERHLTALEESNYAALPSRAYAVGFARSYAKAVGLDSAAIVQGVQAELADQVPEPPRRPAQVFEPGDPARLPGAKVAWLAAAGLLLVLVIGYFAWPSLYSPGGSLPSVLPEETAAPATAAPAPAATPAASGPVVFTATRDRVWVKFSDGAGQQLFQKELALGESFTVPPEIAVVTLTTARPDGLSITVGGRTVPPLSEVERTVRDVPVTAAALLARGTAGVPVPGAAATAAALPAARSVQTGREPRRADRSVAAAPASAAGNEAVAPAAAPAASASASPAADTGTADS